MDKPEPSSQTERAYQRLRSEILHGDLMPGERLRPADLNDKFQLGLTPIREALLRLSSENLVAMDVHRGSRVSETSLGELQDLMASRRAVEGLCLSAAMKHGDAAWEADIVGSMHHLSRTPLPESPDDRAGASRWESRHRAFHHALVRACPEQWLLRFWNILADHSERYRKFRLLRGVAPRSSARDITAEHEALMNAVVGRRQQEAIALMEAHLKATEESVAAGMVLQATPPSTKGNP